MPGRGARSERERKYDLAEALMYGSALLVLGPVALAAAGYSVLGLLRAGLVLLGVEAAILGFVELLKPETTVTFSQGFMKRVQPTVASG